MLNQKVIRNQSSRKKIYQEEMIGIALLKKDSISGKKYWDTWDGEGRNEVIFNADEPLMFPPEELQVGTMVHLLPPEKWDG